MHHELFGIIAALLVVIAFVPYIVKIVKGVVKPHPFTWLIWTITASSICMLQLSNGAGAGAYGSGAMAVFSFFVFISTMRRGMSHVRHIDVICLVIALLGVAVWLIIQEPALSIALLLGVEFIGFLPTLFKAWRKPYEDSAVLWALNGTRQTMSLLAVQHYNIVTLLNPISWMIVAFGFSILILVRRIPAKKPKRVVAKNAQPFSS